jgi:predicted small metal-binding protein
MPKSTDKKSTDKHPMPNIPGTNPDMQSTDGEINPSATSVGTEQWGNTSDERQVLGKNHPAATRAGQMKGNPGDHMAAGSQREHERATTNKRRDDPGNERDLSRRTSASSHSMHVDQSKTTGTHTFRCADTGPADCKWEITGNSEDEVMRRVEDHARHDHGMKDWSTATRRELVYTLR